MNVMSAPPVEAADLLDLKLLPAWVKEPGATKHYDHYTGEEAPAESRSRERHGRHKERKFGPRERRQDTQRPTSKPDRRHRGRMPKKGGARHRDSDRAKNRRPSDRVAQGPPKPFGGTIRFLPRQSVLENVVAQIKSGSAVQPIAKLPVLIGAKPRCPFGQTMRRLLLAERRCWMESGTGAASYW